MPLTRPLGVVVALSALLSGACSTGGSYGSARSAGATPVAMDESGVEIEALVIEGDAVSSRRIVSEATPRQIIRQAHVSLEVDDLEEGERRVLALITAPGFIESTHRSDEFVRIELRVPEDRLDAFLAALDDIGDIEDRSLSARDVTEQVVDWEARIENLVELRDRLRQLLERAETVQDLVMVERELARVQSELDSLTRRLESVRGEVALSRVAVTLTEEVQLGPLGYLFYGLGKAVSWLFFID